MLRLPSLLAFFCLRASRALDCFVASLLAMTLGQTTAPQAD
jgi:hypothetical protein